MQKTEAFVEEVPWFMVDRRQSPDRRTEWRGGRRDSDWTINRPAGALDRQMARTEWWRRLIPGRAH